MDKTHRSLKIRKRKQQGDDSSISLGSIERLIESRVEPLQKQIRVLQSNAITAMVIFGDIRKSVMIAGASSESTKARLEELLDNLDAATSNIQEFIGVPQKILNENYIEPHTMEEVSDSIQEIAERAGALSDQEGDDMVENAGSYEDDMEYNDFSEDEVRRRRSGRARSRRGRL